ncbi:uncharacterized protein LOC116258377 isoform X1 [Nymphaea colorata]|nr:uncharacterized protein LOC116258377 isoform X1 [Nymphaea colorata]
MCFLLETIVTLYKKNNERPTSSTSVPVSSFLRKAPVLPLMAKLSLKMLPPFRDEFWWYFHLPIGDRDLSNGRRPSVLWNGWTTGFIIFRLWRLFISGSGPGILACNLAVGLPRLASRYGTLSLDYRSVQGLSGRNFTVSGAIGLSRIENCPADLFRPHLVNHPFKKLTKTLKNYKCLEEGAEDFIVKPLKPSDLKRLKDYLVGKKVVEQVEEGHQAQSRKRKLPSSPLSPSPSSSSLLPCNDLDVIPPASPSSSQPPQKLARLDSQSVTVDSLLA